MDHLKDNWKNLIEKYIANTCTRKELDQLLQMAESGENKEELSQLLKDHWDKSGIKNDEVSKDLESKFKLLMQQARYEAPVFPIRAKRIEKRWKMNYAAAAIIICLFSIGAYFLFKPAPQKGISKTENIIKEKKEIMPGSNKAVLTLADGSTIILDSAQNGTLTTQGNTKILKLNGKLSYNSLNNNSSRVLFNTISTPKGGQYELVLADGSRVWLNAASSLRFPATFVGNERKVELMGEAYFEVAHISSSLGVPIAIGRKEVAMPFKVEVNGMEVEVLGTHFNINSYSEEAAVSTTLLEGSVKINKNHHTSGILKPGEQAQVNGDGDMKIIKDANVEEAVAWKEGNFQFDRDDIYTVMRQIARWYDIEVEYQGVISSHFVGTISRSVDLSQVLNMLHLTGGVKFEVNGNKVIVIP